MSSWDDALYRVLSKMNPYMSAETLKCLERHLDEGRQPVRLANNGMSSQWALMRRGLVRFVVEGNRPKHTVITELGRRFLACLRMGDEWVARPEPSAKRVRIVSVRAPKRRRRVGTIPCQLGG